LSDLTELSIHETKARERVEPVSTMSVWGGTESTIFYDLSQ